VHIFIDESGSFTRSPGTNSISAVGALTIPDTQLARVDRHYQSIRRTLPKENGEVKGRRLSEPEIARVVTMLAARDVLFEVSTIDLSLGTDAEIASHQAEQADRITAGITPKHGPPAVQLANNLRARLEASPPQLYIQSVLTFSLIARVLDHSTMYYVQRRPMELGAFHWVIDAKERLKTTDWEDWWSYMVMPMLQSKSIKEPMPMIIGQDYSHFHRFDMEIPAYLTEINEAPKSGLVADIRKIMTENFRFSSGIETGLELVDILTNATRRALVGNLKIEGWGNIHRLMIHRREQCLGVVAMGSIPEGHRPAFTSVIRHFGGGGRSMFAH
jgi:hypothetical protein